MKRVREKLHSSRGASIVFALMVFMLCAFAGVAVLVAAASNAGRYTHAEHDQQQYLSVASAVNLLREEFGATKVEITWELEETYTWWYEPITPSPSASPEAGSAFDPKSTTTTELVGEPKVTWYVGDDELGESDSTLLTTLLGDYCKDLFMAEHVPDEWRALVSSEPTAAPTFAPKDLTVSADFDNMIDVHATIAMSPNPYTISIDLGAGPSPAPSASPDLAYETILTLPGTVSSKMESSATSTEGTTNGQPSGQTITTTTLTVTIEWSGEDMIITQNWRDE